MGLQQQISKFIFLSCLTVVIISFSSLIFPALLIEISNDVVKKNVNLFEFGKWSVPLIVSNIIFIGGYILHKKNKLPLKIAEIFNFINDKDISKRKTLVILLVLFSIYSVFSIDELYREEFELGDYKSLPDTAKNFKIESISSTIEIRYFLLHVSYVVFNNIRILPFVASIALLLITYFLTFELTKKRLSSLIAFIVLLQSNLFLLFDTTATYENFWTAFYFFSLYLIFRKPSFSAVSFFFSMAKPLVITYLPISIFAISTKKNSTQNKTILLVSYGIIILIILVAFLTNNLPHTSTLNIDFNYNRLISSFNELGNSLRFDNLILVLLIPTLIILGNKSGEIKNRINLIFVGIFFVIISQPIMYSLIGMTLQPYRFIPLIVFCAIGIGMMFSNSKILDQES